MGFFQLFSKRNNPAKEHDVYRYDQIPKKLRIQIVHILSETFNTSPLRDKLWMMLEQNIKKEFGILSLEGFDAEESVKKFLLSSNHRQAINAIDLIFHRISELIKNSSEPVTKHLLEDRITNSIDELNFRFKQCGIGYEFIDGQLIKINNHLIHQNIVKPAIQLLFEEEFSTASSEFSQAYKHYRKREYEEAITDAERAFESTMKIICHKKGYTYDEKAPAKRLINVLLTNNFIPSYLQNEFNHLCNTLECGLPTIRNRNGSHGQGVTENEIPSYLVNFALNLAASNIVFLVNIYKSN
ncbi:hypothetical protein CN902_10990 [Priestia megaterium]|uniref:STM4504/CBY_0614 family protein n=1 Tax=Priestia megaterium TaxID=1404 RepID=UPI000BFE4037|nr:hypothetical protein [Priestia megaterium]PGK30627.1 hypothetical protein CN902_10990 [Priestia megaterium]